MLDEDWEERELFWTGKAEKYIKKKKKKESSWLWAEHARLNSDSLRP